ncbi:MAG: cyclic nucleotide-binding domain-containing protein [Dehalococcoidia bacterium]
MAREFFVELTEQVGYELEACIGCNLCMRACPLPDAPLMPIGELNEAIAGGVMSQRALRFTLDCTQCGACVPVCPANLSRMRMILAAKLQVEEQSPDIPVFVQDGRDARKTIWTVASLATSLAGYGIFAGATIGQLRRLISQVTLRRYPVGAEVVREEAYTNHLAILLLGAATASVRTADGRRLPLLQLGPGDFFGEYGVLSDRPNPASVAAAAESIVMEVGAAALRRLAAEAPAFDERLRALHGQRELVSMVRRSDLFASLDDAGLRRLLDQARIQIYERGAVIAREGTSPDTLHLVLTGFMKVSRRLADGSERVLTYQRDGSYYADWSIIANETRLATLSANTRCEIVEIPRAAFMAMTAANPAIYEAYRARSSLQYGAMERSVADPPLPCQTEFATLLDEGVLQSHGLLMIDKRLCIDCDACVDACVRRHGHARLERRGLTVGPYLVASACRHCDDPLCLVCPVDALVRTAKGEIVVNDTCIGCGACAARCPYDNIRMADRDEIVDSQHNRWSLTTMLKDFIRPGRPGMAPADDLQQKLAVKCDLCAGFSDGPACVRGCPTGAAFRADGAQFFGGAETIAAGRSISRLRV